MDNRLKQRVTGAVVLTALAIIILPMLLDGSREDRARVIASIPEPPVVELDSLRFEDIERQIDALVAEGEAALPKVTVDTVDYSAQPAETLTLDQNQLPVSWSLQLASFENEDNARSLRASLRDAEYQTYIIRADTDAGERFRVFVGPVLQRSQLAEMGQAIEQKFALKGRVVRYEIQDDARQLGG